MRQGGTPVSSKTPTKLLRNEEHQAAQNTQHCQCTFCSSWLTTMSGWRNVSVPHTRIILLCECSLGTLSKYFTGDLTSNKAAKVKSHLLWFFPANKNGRDKSSLLKNGFLHKPSHSTHPGETPTASWREKSSCWHQLSSQTKENLFQELDLFLLIYEGWELSLKIDKIWVLVPLDKKSLR